jgi:hypothetical protein
MSLAGAARPWWDMAAAVSAPGVPRASSNLSICASGSESGSMRSPEIARCTSAVHSADSSASTADNGSDM